MDLQPLVHEDELVGQVDSPLGFSPKNHKSLVEKTSNKYINFVLNKHSANHPGSQVPYIFYPIYLFGLDSERRHDSKHINKKSSLSIVF